MITKSNLQKYTLEAVLSVKNEIDKDPLKKKELVQMAVEAGIGRNNLQKGFKELFGFGIKEYIFQKRMETAKDMLEQGSFTRKQIAYKLGYRKPNNFSIAFKKKFGFSPNEFRNQFLEAS
jgi:AraC family transcriptional regulator, transcriptional activator of the genes for pyochelin and ferripyochelin receptors